MPIVSIKDTNHTFEVNKGEILYDSLFDRGHTLPHGCLSGSCGACKVEILEGKDQLEKPGVIEQNTIDSLKEEFKALYGEDFIKEKVIRLSCRAKIIGDVKIKTIK